MNEITVSNNKSIAAAYIKTMKKLTASNLRPKAFAVVLFMSAMVSPGYFPVVIILEICTLLSYYRKYFNAYYQSSDSMIPALKSQSVPLKEIFSKLQKNILPLEVVFFVYYAFLSLVEFGGGVSGFFDHVNPMKLVGFKELSEVHPMSIASLVIWPVLAWLVPFVCRRYMEYKMTHANTKAISVLAGFFHFMLLNIVGYFTGIVIAMMGVFIVIAIVIHGQINVPDDEAVMYAFSGSSHIFTIIAMICMVIWVSMVLRDDIKKFRIGKMNMKIAAFVIGIIAVTLCIEINAQNYVKSSEDGFATKSFTKEKEYSYEDVTDFKIYCHDDSMFMRLYLKDGNKVELFSDITEESEMWTDKYDNYYEYAYEIAVKLRGMGVEGKLEDAAKLTKMVKGYDKEIRDSLEKIKGLYE